MAATAIARPAQFDPAAQHRRAMIAKIHVANKQLQIDEDDYRQGMLDTVGKFSLRECSDAELQKVLDWLKSKGFRALPKRTAAAHPMARKARALWISLYHLNAVHNPSEQALEAFAKRQLGCERLVWARQSDAYKLIEALKSMARRHGWMMHSPITGKQLGPLELRSALCHTILRKLIDAGVCPANWELHEASEKLCGIANARDTGWTPDDYQKLATALGNKLREFGAHQGEDAA